MVIVFTKLPGQRYSMLVRDRVGPDVKTRPVEIGQDLPHDLVHAAVEEALGIDDGFWGATAAGATFEGFEPVEPSRHRRSGLKVLRRKGDSVMEAELAVGWAYRVWSGKPVTGRGLGRSPITDEQVARALPALDAAASRWAEVPEGGSLVWTW